jgi:Escherichia/Staphylococcus phage prohead protease
MTPPEEKRVHRGAVELRAGGARRVGGYAAVFNKRSVNLGGFHKILDPRTFNKSRSDGFPGVICRFNHDDSLLLGTVRAGTLRLDVDSRGLLYEVDVPLCRNDVYEMTQRGDLAHSSFAFQAYEDDWSYDNSGPVRKVLSARLIDVAPVTNPAYPDATVGLRSLARHVGAPMDDVIDLAQRGELSRLFVRTDMAPPGRNPRAALIEAMGRRYSDGSPITSNDGREYYAKKLREL